MQHCVLAAVCCLLQGIPQIKPDAFSNAVTVIVGIQLKGIGSCSAIAGPNAEFTEIWAVELRGRIPFVSSQRKVAATAGQRRDRRCMSWIVPVEESTNRISRTIESSDVRCMRPERADCVLTVHSIIEPIWIGRHVEAQFSLVLGTL